MHALAFALLLAAQTPDAPPPTPSAPVDAPSTTDAAPPPVDAPPPSGDAQLALSFADHLFLDGDWYRAISEYRRYLFLVKGRSAEAPRAALAIGEAYLRGEQWDAAGRQLDGIAQRAADEPLRRIALFGAGRAYLLDGRPEYAKPRFRLLVEDQQTPRELLEEAQWLLAWGQFDAGELELAEKTFMTIAAAGGRRAMAARGVVDALRTRAAVDFKDPLLAGVLSLVPGLGHFYLGQWGVGLTSLVWNGLFIFAATSAWLTGQWGPALVLTLFEIGWYGGAVFGAVAGAYKHNRDAVRNWRDEVLSQYGQGRELPEMHELKEDPPGAMVRFGVAF